MIRLPGAFVNLPRPRSGSILMNKHVVIIGGGVIGLSAAAECAARGHRVTVIEADPVRRGASLGNAGMVVPSHFVPLAAPGMVALGLKWMWNPESPFYIEPRADWGLVTWALRFMTSATREHVERSAPLLRDLHLASRVLYARFAEQADFGLVRKGLLMLCKTAHALDEEAATARHARELGVPADVLDATSLAALDPTVTMSVAGGVHFPQDCHLDPSRYVAALEARLRAAGADLRWDCRVTGWRREGARLAAVVTSQGAIDADEFVLCGGAWSDELVSELGLRLPMQAGRGYSVTVPDPVQLPALCSIFTEARVAVTPMGESLRFGGTMEITARDSPPRPRRVAGILKAVPDYFPAFKGIDLTHLPFWSGLRPCSPDGLPYLGRTRAASNLTVATAHAMMGLSLAPATGEIVGQLIDGETPALDLRPLDPDRWA
jgi:D-amino-acid dehydrogenase